MYAKGPIARMSNDLCKKRDYVHSCVTFALARTPCVADMARMVPLVHIRITFPVYTIIIVSRLTAPQETHSASRFLTTYGIGVFVRLILKAFVSTYPAREALLRKRLHI